MTKHEDTTHGVTRHGSEMNLVEIVTTTPKNELLFILLFQKSLNCLEYSIISHILMIDSSYHTAKR